MRSAYGIPGNACEDIMAVTVFPCCAANQMLQTADTKGAIPNYGRTFNTNPRMYYTVYLIAVYPIMFELTI